MGARVNGYLVADAQHPYPQVGLPWRVNGLRGFAPTQLSGCALWLRADLGVTLNGSTVSAWANQGTAGGSVSQGTAASQPTWSATGGPNSRAALAFDGGDWLTSDLAASAWAFLHSANSTAFVVWKTTSANPNAYFGVLSTASSGTPDRGFALFYDDRSGLSRNDRLIANINNGGANVASLLTGNNAFPAATWGVAEYVFAYQDAGSDLIALVNGTSVGTSESAVATSASAPQGPLELGRLVSDTGSRLIGSITEVIAFNRTLNAGERSQLRRYLGSYYAITVV